MSSIYKRNAIISGYLQSYCLVCNSVFDSVAGILDHLDKEDHRKQLLAYPYLEKFGDEHIRKVTKGYFCEFCGVIFATPPKVSIHVKERSHIHNRAYYLLNHSNGVVTAFNDILISENAWHGLDNGTCALCNVDYSDVREHTAEPNHLINLVQTRVEFGPNNNVYRELGDDSFQCLTCNTQFSLNSIDEHFDDTQHKELYAKCQQDMKDHRQKSQSETTIDKQKDKKLDKNRDSIKKENKVENEVISYTKQHNLTYKPGNTKALCTLCEMKVPSSLGCLKEHVNGKEHKSRLSKSLAKPETKQVMIRETMSEFVKHHTTVVDLFHKYVIVNRKICIDHLSFSTICDLGSNFHCLVCDMRIVYVDDIELHIKWPKHKMAIGATHIITSLPGNEFVREIRPLVFHCGHCHLLLNGEDVLHCHLKVASHREAREADAWRAQRHMPDLKQSREQSDKDFIRGMVFGQIRLN